MSTRSRTRAALEAAAVTAADHEQAAQSDRQRRRKAIAAMLVCVALVNGIQYGYINRQPVVGPLVFAAGSVMFLAALAMIGFYLAACIVYARMRGYGPWAGVGGAVGGLAVWLGITLYLQWGVITALANHQPTPDWDEHPFIALWAGLAIGGAILKSLPARPGSALFRSTPETLEDTVA